MEAAGARCRACGRGGEARGLQEAWSAPERPDLPDLLARHLHIAVCASERLPTMLCMECREKLISFHEFYEECSQTQKRLQAEFQVKPDGDVKPENLGIYPACVETELLCKNLKSEIKLEEPHVLLEVAEMALEDDFINDFDYIPSPRRVKKKIKKRAKIKKTRVNPTHPRREGEINVNDYFCFKCNTCNEDLHSWYRLRSHSLKAHKVEPVVKCVVCKMSVRSKSVLYKHIADHKSPTVFTCDQCSKITKSARAMDNHKMRHIPESERVYQCETCSKVFKTKDTLKTHQSSHAPIEERKIFPCTVCDMKFTTKSAAVGHKRAVHDKIKRFVCDLCGYACSTSNELRQHRAIHSDEKPFVCPICSKPFKTDSNLRTHVDSHSHTSYECPECNKILNSRKTLLKHRLVHDTTFRHVCSFCHKAFKRRQTLKAHLNSHTGDKPIECKWCSERFMYAASYRAHKLRRHPDKLTNTSAAKEQSTLVQIQPLINIYMHKSKPQSPTQSEYSSS